MKHEHDYIREEGFYDRYSEPTIESCFSLWNACLFFNFHEALYGADTVSPSWILSFNPDFIDVCNLAGYDPHTVREKFIKLCNKKNKRR